MRQLKQGRGMSSTAGALHTDNMQGVNNEEQSEEALKMCCKIEKDFRLTNMYHALTEMIDDDRTLVDDGKDRHEENFDRNVDKGKVNTEMHENIAMDMKTCVISECDNKQKKTCEKCDKKKELCENCGKRKCDDLTTGTCTCICYSTSNSEWSENEYLLFDLYRIKEVLQKIVFDVDYKNLKIEHNEDTAEYVLSKIHHYPVVYT